MRLVGNLFIIKLLVKLSDLFVQWVQGLQHFTSAVHYDHWDAFVLWSLNSTIVWLLLQQDQKTIGSLIWVVWETECLISLIAATCLNFPTRMQTLHSTRDWWTLAPDKKSAALFSVALSRCRPHACAGSTIRPAAAKYTTNALRATSVGTLLKSTLTVFIGWFDYYFLLKTRFLSL